MAGKYKLEGKNALEALKLLKKVAMFLEQNKIPYILEAGTLLGIIRENRLLPWDNDMDITITGKNEKKLLGHLWKLFFKRVRVSVRHYKQNAGPFKKGQVRIIKLSNYKWLFFKGPVQLDIFIKREIGDEYQWTIDVRNPVLKGVPKKFYDELGTYDFDKHKYSVPLDYEGYLTCHYGDWRTPVKKWAYRTADQNVKEILKIDGRV
jgi:phosphorylcholine metabolism protein LicD